MTLLNIGVLHFQLHQFDEAHVALQRSVVLSEQTNRPETLWAGYRSMGRLLWESGKPEEAVGYYRKAIDTIETIYSQTVSLKSEVRSSMIGDKTFVYKEFIDLLLQLHKKSPEVGHDREAFMISEKAKSRVFKELMAKAGATTVLAKDAKAVSREVNAREEDIYLRNNASESNIQKANLGDAGISYFQPMAFWAPFVIVGESN